MPESITCLAYIFELFHEKGSGFVFAKVSFVCKKYVPRLLSKDTSMRVLLLLFSCHIFHVFTVICDKTVNFHFRVRGNNGQVLKQNAYHSSYVRLMCIGSLSFLPVLKEIISFLPKLLFKWNSTLNKRSLKYGFLDAPCVTSSQEKSETVVAFKTLLRILEPLW